MGQVSKPHNLACATGDNVIPFATAQARGQLKGWLTGLLDIADTWIQWDLQYQKFRLARRARVDRKIDLEYGLDWQRDNAGAAKRLRKRLYNRATRKMGKALKRAWKLRERPKPLKAGVRCPAGLGKSRTMAEVIAARWHGGRLHSPVGWTATNHAKAEETQAELEALGVPVMILQGRAREDKAWSIDESLLIDIDDRGKMCPRHEQAAIVGESGESVRDKLCRPCPLIEVCGWNRQLKEADEITAANGVLIMVTAHLYCHVAAGRPLIQVVDEDFVAAASRKVSVPQSDIDPMKIVDICGDFGRANTDEICRTTGTLARILIRKEEADATAVALEGVADLESLLRILRAAKQFAQAKLKVGRTDAPENLRRELGQSQARRIGKLIVLVNEILNLARREIRLVSIVWEKSNDGSGSDYIHVHYLVKPRIPVGSAVIILDATLRQTRAAALLGIREEDLPVTVVDVPHNLIVRHVSCSASKMKLLANHRPDDAYAQEKADAYLRSTIEGCKAHYPGQKILWISNIEVENAVREILADDIEAGHSVTAHYFATRGSNAFSDCDAVVCIGQAMPGLDDIEHQAAALAGAEGQNIVTMKEWLKDHPDVTPKPDRFVEGADGLPWHPDPYVRELVESMADNEIIQSAGRIRAINSKRPKGLTIVGKRVPAEYAKAVEQDHAPVNDTVNIFLQREFSEHGFAVCSAVIAYAKHPDLWTSADSARKRLAAAKAEGRLVCSTAGHPEPVSYRSYDEPGSGTPTPSDTPPAGYTLAVHVRGRSRPVLVLSRRLLSLTELQTARPDLGDIVRIEDQTVRTVEPAAAAIDSADVIMVARSTDKVPATKKFSASPSGAVVKKTFPLDRSKWFRFEEQRVQGIRDLASQLEELAADPFALVVRGALLPGIDIKKPARRAMKPKRRPDGKVLPPSLRDAKRYWVQLDLDNYRLPLGMSFMDDPAYAAKIVHAALPEPFCSTTCYARASSSAGMSADPSEVRMHLWFWLEQPLTSAELNRALKEIDVDKMIDYRLANPVQIHYTADPIFEGVPDPLAQRGWLLVGKRDKAWLEIPEILPLPPAEVSDVDRMAAPRIFQIELKAIGDERTGGQGFQGPVLKAARWAAIAIQTNRLGLSQAVSMISAAVYAADPGGRPPEEIDRYASEHFIMEKIEWWTQTFRRLTA